MTGWPLADPIACPGLFDLLAVIVSRTWRDVAPGTLIETGNAVALAVALGLLARAVHAMTKTAVVTVAITLAATITAIELLRVLVPSPAAAFALTIATWLAVLRSRQETAGRKHRRLAIGLLSLLAATVPPFTLPVVIVAAWLKWPRGPARASLAALLAIVPSMVVQAALTTAPATLVACVIPLRGVASVVDAGSIFVGLVTATPLAAGLAILGLLEVGRVPRDLSRSLLPLALLAFWGVAVMPSQSAAATGAFVVVFWMLAAAGLKEVWDYATHSTGGNVGTVALSIALVVLHGLSANARRDLHVPNDGHERLTVTSMGAIIGALPRGAGLVEEDAITDLLMRALPARMRTSDRFHVIRRDANAVADALRNGPVYALPRSQRVLQHLGFELAEVAGIPGLVAIRQAHPCTAELGSAPDSLASIVGRQGVALVAGDDRSRDVVVIMLASDAPLAAAPLDWPPAALRGIHGRPFDLTVASHGKDLVSELEMYGLSSWSALGNRHVTRIEAWRTPASPLVLPIAIASPIRAAIGRRTGDSPDQHLRLCPSIPYQVRALGQRAQ